MSNLTLDNLVANLDNYSEIINKAISAKKIDPRISKDVRMIIEKLFRLEPVLESISKSVVSNTNSRFLMDNSSLKMTAFENFAKLNFLNKAQMVNANYAMSDQIEFSVNSGNSFYRIEDEPLRVEGPSSGDNKTKTEAFFLRKYLVYFAGQFSKAKDAGEKQEEDILNLEIEKEEEWDDVIELNENKVKSKMEGRKEKEKGGQDLILKNIHTLNISDSLKQKFLSGIKK